MKPLMYLVFLSVMFVSFEANASCFGNGCTSNATGTVSGNSQSIVGNTTATVGNVTATTGNSVSNSTVGNVTATTGNTTGGTVNNSIKEVYQAPNLSGPASGPCTGFSGGLSAPGFGINGAKVDKECEKREAIRVLLMAGMVDEARQLALNLDVVKELHQEQKQKNIAYTEHANHLREVAINAEKEWRKKYVVKH